MLCSSFLARDKFSTLDIWNYTSTSIKLYSPELVNSTDNPFIYLFSLFSLFYFISSSFLIEKIISYFLVTINFEMPKILQYKYRTYRQIFLEFLENLYI